jgi:hypothetical protein
VVVLIPQAWQPHATLPEPWEAPERGVNIYGLGLYGWLFGWLRSQFGFLGGGLFMVAEGTALSVALTIGSVDSTRWKPAGFAFLGATAGSFLVALLGGLIVRRYGRLAEAGRPPT